MSQSLWAYEYTVWAWSWMVQCLWVATTLVETPPLSLSSVVAGMKQV